MWRAVGIDFSLVYDTHAATVLRSLRRLGVREAELEDAAQEVFVIIHRKLPEFEGRSSLKTWIVGICIRVASDWRQRAYVRRETQTDAVPERTISGETPTRQIAMRQARKKLDALLNELDTHKREVFVLFELEQLSMTEVAEAIGAPVQTAYARLYAARKFIEQAVARQHQEVNV